MLKNRLYVVLVVAISMVLLLKVPLPANGDANRFVGAILDDKQLFFRTVNSLDKSADINEWVLMHFENETVNALAIKATEEGTTLLDCILQQRTFYLIVNEGRQAEYFMTLVVHRDKSYEIDDLSVRVQ